MKGRVAVGVVWLGWLAMTAMLMCCPTPSEASIQPVLLRPGVARLYKSLQTVTPFKSTIPPLECSVCMFLMDELHDLLERNGTIDDLEDFFTDLCILFEIEVESVCAGLASEFGPEVVDIMGTRFVSAEEVCVHFLVCPESSAQESNDDDDDAGAIAQTLLAASRSLRQNKLDKLRGVAQQLVIENEKAAHMKMRPVAKNGVGTFLQLTDVHIDELYKPGTNTKCDTPLCCRAEYGPGTAGKWGEYTCDLPTVTFQHMLNYITTNVSLDFVLWTGDNPPHDIWKESKAGQLNRTSAITQIIQSYFPHTPVFPAIGNHESFPVDQFPDSPRNAWLMDPLAAMWTPWLPPDALTTLRLGGYYTTLVRPGFRIVSINTQYCDLNNFWLVLNDTDPTGQLAWLSSVLAAAQKAGEAVYIVGHIPPGDSTCLYKYASKYIALFQQYASIIRGQFFGHTHHDSFTVMYDTSNKPAGVAYVAPSVTTYSYLNPSFRVFEYDRSSAELLDYHQYHADIALANKNGEPEWIEAYSAKKLYNLTSLEPAQWQALAERMRGNTPDADAVFELYYHNFHTQYSGLGPCKGDCKLDYTCTLISPTALQFLNCTGSEYNLGNLWEWVMNHLC